MKRCKVSHLLATPRSSNSSASDFLSRDSSHSLTSLLLSPAECEVIRSHCTSLLPLRVSTSVVGLHLLHHLSIHAQARRVTGFRDDGSVVLYERSSFFYSEHLIAATAPRLAELLLAGVFGLGRGLSEEQGSEREEVLSEITLEDHTSPLLLSLNREGVLRLFDVENKRVRHSQPLFAASTSLLEEAKLAVVRAPSALPHHHLFAVISRGRDSGSDVASQWKIDVFSVGIADNAVDIRISLQHSSALPLPSLLRQDDVSVSDVLSALPSDVTLQLSPSAISSQHLLTAASSWSITSLHRVERGAAHAERRCRGVLLLTSLPVDLTGEEVKVEEEEVRSVLLTSPQSKRCGEVVAEIEHLVVTSSPILAIQEKLTSLLVREGVFSVETVVSALHSFHTTATPLAQSQPRHPLLRLLQRLSATSSTTASASPATTSSLLPLLVEAVLMSVDQRSQQMMAMTSAQAKNSDISTNKSADFRHLVYYSKSAVDFLQHCDVSFFAKKSVALALPRRLVGGGGVTLDFLLGGGRGEVQIVLSGGAQEVTSSVTPLVSMALTSQFLAVLRQRLLQLTVTESDVMQVIASFTSSHTSSLPPPSHSLDLSRLTEQLRAVLTSLTHLITAGREEVRGANSALLADILAQDWRNSLQQAVRHLLSLALLLQYVSDYRGSALSLSSDVLLRTSLRQEVHVTLFVYATFLLGGDLFPARGGASEEVAELFVGLSRLTDVDYHCLPHLIAHRSLAENFHFLALLQKPRQSRDNNPLSYREALAGISREWLLFALHYAQPNLLRLLSLATSSLQHLLAIDEENDLEDDADSEGELALLHRLNELWISLTLSHSKALLLLRQAGRGRGGAEEHFTDVMSLIRQTEEALIALLRSSSRYADIITGGGDGGQGHWRHFGFSAIRTSFRPFLSSLGFGQAVAVSGEELVEEVARMWSVVQQLHLLELYQQPLQNQDAISSQLVHLLHRIQHHRSSGSSSEVVWRSLSLKALQALSLTCDESRAIPRAVTQALFFTLAGLTSSDEEGSTASNNEVVRFQRLFCSDFFRRLTKTGQFFALYQLDKLLRGGAGGAQLLTQLYEAVFSADDASKEVLVEVLFAIHVIENDFHKAIHLFLAPPLPSLLSARRMAIALTLTSLLPPHERFALTSQPALLDTSSEHLLAVQVLSDGAADTAALLSRFYLRYVIDLLQPSTPFSSEAEVVTALLQREHWHEALSLKQYQRRHYHKSSGDIEDTSATMAAMCHYDSVEEVLLFLAHFLNQQPRDTAGQRLLQQISPSLSFFPCVSATSSGGEGGADDVANEWILHFITTYQSDEEVQRHYFVSLLRYFATTSHTTSSVKVKKTFALLLHSLVTAWQRDAEDGNDVIVPRALGVVDATPVLLQCDCVEEAYLVLKERMLIYADALQALLHSLNTSSKKRGTESAETWLWRLYGERRLLLSGQSIHRLRLRLTPPQLADVDALLAHIQQLCQLLHSLAG